MDFTPKSGLQGLGYRGLDPGLALQGSGAAQHIELFDPQGGRLFGDSQRGSRRRGVAGQVGRGGPQSWTTHSCWSLTV